MRIHPSSVAYGLLPSPSLVHVLRVVESKRRRVPIERDACQVCRAERVCTKTWASDPEDEDSHRQSRGVQDDGNAPRQDRRNAWMETDDVRGGCERHVLVSTKP